MNNILIEKLVYMLIGGAAGSIITGWIMKKKNDELADQLEEARDKYDNRMDEEVEKMYESIREEYGKNERNVEKHNGNADDDSDEDAEKLEKISSDIANRVKQAKEKPDMENLIKKNGYRNEPEPEDDDDEDEEEEDLDDTESPFLDEDDIIIIAPEEFGEYHDYDREYLFYLRDKVLVDDQGNAIEDIDDLVGYDSLTQFGAYEDNNDHVYVRNLRLKTDYDIFRDTEHTFKNFKER